ncbi:MAG: peptidoglycan DD-metalloendopeptidase family protein [Armatimonadota bacterium]|jgi:murein DD-endopeptidase MepM/ murein hydrolase activator NlpD|nr:peptidoglycan DD-metalloendopeptidase family protein [Armatimonadota bacterium]MDT7972397.1 peptidoglycan DD-metalloendopeptidase family protein [Armatimonadota bacterium]
MRKGAWLLSLLLLFGTMAQGEGQGWLRSLLSRGKPPNPQALRQRQKELERRKQMARQKIREMRKKERSLSEQLRDTRQRIATAQARLAVLNREYQKVAAELRQTRERVLAVRARLSRHRSLLAERLRQLYKHPPADYVLFALSAPDVTEAAMRTYVFRRIVHHDSTMIQATQQTKAELEREMELLRRQQAKLASLRASIAEQARELRQAEAEQTDLLRRIQTERKTYEQWLKEWEEESKAIAALLRRLQMAQRRSPRPIPAWRGPFLRPVSGSIVSGFGYRRHPILGGVRFHYGVDIAAPFGTTIRAAADGVVVFAGWRRAYGNTVIIDHGNGLATLYAHCSELLVSEGAVVRQGQPIARVGSTGLTTGPHLHFEVRRYGEPVNPLTEP